MTRARQAAWESRCFSVVSRFWRLGSTSGSVWGPWGICYRGRDCFDGRACFDV
jgi:hypothetical protein